MTEDELKRALSKLAREQSGEVQQSLERITGRIKSEWFPAQTDCHVDTHPLKAIRCARRVGKTFWASSESLITLLKDDAHILFISKVREQSERNFWRPALDMAESVGLKVETNKSELSISCPDSGGYILLRGCETMADIVKFEGTYYDDVFIDEAQGFSESVLHKLIFDSLMPCLLDRNGRLTLMGRPEGAFVGTFFQATGPDSTAIRVEPNEEGKLERRSVSRPFEERDSEKWAGVRFTWSLHGWTQQDNVKSPKLWANAQELKKINGWSDSHPVWMRQYLGLWVGDDSLMVYRFVDMEAAKGEKGRYLPKMDGEDYSGGSLWVPGPRTKNNPFGIPGGDDLSWRYCIGVDMGNKDPFTIQVTAYSPNHPIAYMACYEFEETGIGLRRMALEICEAVAHCAGWDGVHGQLRPVADGEFGVAHGTQLGERLLSFMRLGLDLVDGIWGDVDKFGGEVLKTMTQEYGVIIKGAKKKDKLSHIEALNTDMMDRRALVRQGSALSKEMMVLSWDDTKKKEKSGQRNHQADAGLYATINARHHDAMELEPAGVRSQVEIDSAAMNEHRNRVIYRSDTNDQTDIGSLAPISEWEWE